MLWVAGVIVAVLCGLDQPVDWINRWIGSTGGLDQPVFAEFRSERAKIETALSRSPRDKCQDLAAGILPHGGRVPRGSLE